MKQGRDNIDTNEQLKQNMCAGFGSSFVGHQYLNRYNRQYVRDVMSLNGPGHQTTSIS